MSAPEKPSLDGLEQKWSRQWEADRTFAFDRTKTRDQIFSIDTPPPTVSGSLHMGSVFGYAQTDSIARFQRMRGKELFYPMGWDDNGLPTERRVQNFYGVRCDPSIPYDPDDPLPDGAGKQGDQKPISRQAFIELCHKLTAEDEQAFEHLWRTLGLSVDWELTYATIDDRARTVAQRMFLRNLARGEAYATDAPTLWDVDFQSAVAQAELEDREQSAAYHRISFHGPSGPIFIETTRPELIPSCVALVANPDDERYQPLFGTTVRTPLFDVEVPVHAHHLADPEKGSGIAMICTFGDTTDVTWWRELDLPVRAVIQRDGRLQVTRPEWLTTGPWEELGGKTAKQAQKRIVELLAESGDLQGEPRPITHAVKFFEKGDRPLEIVTSRQWYIRNGGRDAELRAALLERGQNLGWHPSFMHVRYDHWVNGLNGDWLISRQRFFGVPFPVWYPIDENGTVQYESPIVADELQLPVDPSAEPAPGYDESLRGKPGGFLGDPDVMDTWATSSLSPQITTGWVDDEDLFERTFPMDLRPQGPEIIRTWLFATIVRAHFEHGCLPWSDTSINGWVLDPDRKKMSKSIGNVVTPMPLLEEFGGDAIRYWACRGAPGTDTAADKGVMKVGRRLAIKVLNVTKFVLGLGAEEGATIDNPVDRSMLAQLDAVIATATASYDDYEYTRALDAIETFFWHFCDDYVELVKGRAYTGDASAKAALATALSSLQRLLAPFLAFATEEVWSWWKDGSIHRQSWPTPLALGGDPLVLDVAADALAQVRKVKTEAKRSLRTAVISATITDAPERIAALRDAASDVRDAGAITDLVLAEGSASVDVTLEPPEAAS
jgi:valyl-tRNA synthetase